MTFELGFKWFNQNLKTVEGEINGFTGRTQASLDSLAGRMNSVVQPAFNKLNAGASKFSSGINALRPLLGTLGYQVFPQLSNALSLTSQSFQQLQQSAALTNAQLARLGVIGVVAAGAAYGIQKSFEKLWKSQNDLSQTLGDETSQGHLLAFVKKLGEAGEITGKQYRDLHKALNGALDTKQLNDIRARLRTILADQPTAVDLLRGQLKSAATQGNTLEASSDTFAQRGIAAAGEEAINANLLHQAELWRDINAAIAERQQKLRANLDLTDAEMVKNKEWLTLESEREEALSGEMAMRRMVRDRERAINEQRLNGTRDMFANMADAAKAFGKQGFAAYKAFATGQALIDTYKAATGAYASMVSIPYVGPVIAVAAAAAAVAAGMANIAQIQSASYAQGGFTGAGPTYEVAGQVHRGEWVVPAWQVSKIGLGNLESTLRYLTTANYSAPVPITSQSGSDAAAVRRGMAGGGSGGSGSVQPSFDDGKRVAFFDDRQALHEFLQSRVGEKWVIEIINNNRGKVGIRT